MWKELLCLCVFMWLIQTAEAQGPAPAPASPPATSPPPGKSTADQATFHLSGNECYWTPQVYIPHPYYCNRFLFCIDEENPLVLECGPCTKDEEKCPAGVQIFYPNFDGVFNGRCREFKVTDVDYDIRRRQCNYLITNST